MKAYISILLIVIFSFSACDKVELNEEVPSCMEKKINEYKNSNLPCSSGKSVYRYKFQGEYVYVFDPGNCGADMMSDVFDEACNSICGLGGIAGNITCVGDDFGKNAIEETLIWQN